MRRSILFLFFNILMVMVFYGPLKDLLKMSFRSELYSHIILIPLVSGYFIYQKRKTLISEAKYSYLSGIALIIAGIVLFLIGSNDRPKLGQNDYLSLMTFSAVTFWIGGFMFFYGKKAFRLGIFPLFFLFFLVPIPSLILNKFILFLQIGSAEVTEILFKLIGIPVFREEFTFHLSRISIEVAKQCSGIRSSIALIITGIIAGELFLQTGWKKLVLVLFTIPITIIKNGLRIVTLSLLGAYVNPAILGTDLHKRGGIPFFILALLLLAPILWAFMKSEKKSLSPIHH